MEIKDYEGLYEVTQDGTITSLTDNHSKKRGMVLKFKTSKQGYLSVVLYKKGKRKEFLVHRLVGQAYIPNPENKPQINHINGIKSDNRVENLEWATRSENMQHSVNVLGNKSTNLGGFGKDNLKSKKVFQYSKDGMLVGEYDGVREAGRETGIDHRSISSVAAGSKVRKSAGGYVWAYE